MLLTRQGYQLPDRDLHSLLLPHERSQSSYGVEADIRQLRGILIAYGGARGSVASKGSHYYTASHMATMELSRPPVRGGSSIGNEKERQLTARRDGKDDLQEKISPR